MVPYRFWVVIAALVYPACSLTIAVPLGFFGDAGYGIKAGGPGLRAVNAAQHFSVQFSGAQTSIDTGNGSAATLMLAAYGWGSALHAAGPVTQVSCAGKRVNRQYGATLREWFENSAEGLEQGFVLSQRDRKESGPLRIVLSAGGGWQVVGAADGVQLTNGATTLEYGGLRAWDASGSALPSQMRVRDHNIEIEVDDGNAVYPLTIDPAFTQQAILTASDGNALGSSLSLSSDGKTAIIGSTGNNSFTGAAYVFTRSSTGAWAQQQELTAPDGASGDYFGISVALSGDGNTAIVGANQIEPGVITNGAAYVYVRAGANWTLQAELMAADAGNNDFFGAAVSLAYDGNTALVGAPGNSQFVGSAYVFTRSGTSWSQQELKIATTATDTQFGYAVALSGDGNTVVASAYSPSAAYVFTRSGATWSLQKTFTGAAAGGDNFGASLALSNGGNTALIGAPSSNSGSGEAYVFTRAGTRWTRQQTLNIAGTGYTGYASLGQVVALSSNGNSAVVGASGASLNANGSAFVFGRSGTTWALRQQIAPAAANDSSFGESVALSGDGSTALVGEYNAAHVYLFSASASAGPPTVISVSPSAGAAPSQSFTAVYADLNGAADLASVRILFNAEVSAANACYVTYYPALKAMYLTNDAGTHLSAPVVPGSTTTATNSQCTLAGKGSAYGTSGNTATLTVALTFSRTPPENIYLYATEANGSSSGWQQEGTWGATLGPPATISVSPDAGSGKAQIFSAVYSDPNGAEDFAALRVLFNTTLSDINGCRVVYYPATNALYLANDAGAALSSPVTPGSSAQVSNSKCTLLGTGSAYSTSGNDATLAVALGFNGIIPEQKLTAPGSGAAQSGEFGSAASLSSDGNTALIGAEGINDFNGAAYVFTNSSAGWSAQQELTASDAANIDFFGEAVALSGDGNTALVGASGDIETSGAAYIFARSASGWTQQQKFAAPSPAAADSFGYAVALSSNGTTALVGANASDIYVNTNGQAYVFTRSGTSWTQQQELVPPNATGFGSSVALSSDGNTAIVGAQDNNAAYVFRRTGASWNLQQELIAAGAVSNFGSSVALSNDGNMALVGATGNNSSAGAAYLFTRSGTMWTQQYEFTAVDSAANSYFGSSVALGNNGSVVLIGAYDGDSNTGAAYPFTRSGTSWTAQLELTAGDAARNDSFGSSVALSGSGTTALVGASGKSNLTGASYVFSLNAGFTPGPTQKVYLEASENNGSTSGWVQLGSWLP